MSETLAELGARRIEELEQAGRISPPDRDRFWQKPFRAPAIRIVADRHLADVECRCHIDGGDWCARTALERADWRSEVMCIMLCVASGEKEGEEFHPEWYRKLRPAYDRWRARRGPVR